MTIRGVTPTTPTAPTVEGELKLHGEKAEAQVRAPFEQALSEAVSGASALGHVAAGKAKSLADGTGDDLHGAMIAMKEAEISVKLVGSIRNKLIDAFHELWRTSV